MAYSFSEDSEATFFATTSDSYTLNFDSFFDLDTDCPQLDPSDASTSHGSTSTDINLFEDLDFEAAFLDNKIFNASVDVRSCTAAIAPPSWLPHQILNSTAPLQATPKSRRLVYRLRPEGISITGAQLLALENKDNPHIPMTHDTLSSPFPTAFAATPPTTPHHNRVQLSTPQRKQKRHMHRPDRGSYQFRPAYKPEPTYDSPQAMSLTESEPTLQQTRMSSPQFAEWTKRLRHLAVQSPQHTRMLPISPPPSTKIDQAELSQDSSQKLDLDTQDILFNPSSSTTTSSVEPIHPFLDDSSPSTADSSPWNLDAATELFGLKQDPWDFSSIDLENNSAKSVPSSQVHSTQKHEDLIDTFDNPFSIVSNDNGLGISFGNDDDDDLDTNPFKTTILPTTQQPSSFEFSPQFHLKSNNSSTKLPTLPFNSPTTSEFCSPALLSSDPSIMTPTLALTSISSSSLSPSTRCSSKPAHQTTHKTHRRTKSNPPLVLSSPSARRASAAAVGKVRASSSSSKMSKGEKKSVGGSAGLGFVNFTPEDRTRILTGVAPSGSSKTKARREKEAAERRRKFSEAAKRLVVEAGGDWDAVDQELSD